MSRRISALFLLVLAAFSAAEQLTQNPDTPEYVLIASLVHQHLREDIEARLTPLQEAITEIKEELRDACRRSDVVDTQAVFPPNLSDNEVTEMKAKLEAVHQVVLTNGRGMDTLESKLEEITEGLMNIPRQEAVESKVATLLNEGMENITKIVKEESQVEKLIKEEAERVEKVIVEVRDTCGSNLKVEELLQKVGIVETHVETVIVETEATRNKVEECARQQTEEEVRGVREQVEEVATKVERLHEVLQVKLEDIAGKVDEISNSTLQLSATPPQEEEEQEKHEQEQEKHEQEQHEQEQQAATGLIYPCEDSSFLGTTHGSTCRLALRFRKCHLPTVSYHCCNTCTSLGFLPEMGPWRLRNSSRVVLPLDIIRFFAP